MKRLLFIFTLLFFAITGLVCSVPAYAEEEPAPTESRNCKQPFLGLPRWYDYLELDADCKVVGPCVDKDSPSTPVSDCASADSERVRLDITKVVTRVALAVIDILLRLGGMVAFGFVVYSGFRFVASQGNADQEKAARETAINAIIGMVITIFAIAIVTFIGNQISK